MIFDFGFFQANGTRLTLPPSHTRVRVVRRFALEEPGQRVRVGPGRPPPDDEGALARLRGATIVIGLDRCRPRRTWKSPHEAEARRILAVRADRQLVRSLSLVPDDEAPFSISRVIGMARVSGVVQRCAVYLVVYRPTRFWGKGYPSFRDHIPLIAKRVGDMVGQDEVLLVHHDGKRRTPQVIGR